MAIDHLLARIVDACRRRAVLVAAAGVVLAALSLLYAAGHLGLVTDSDKLFADTLPWRQRAAEMDRLFPQFRDLLVMVVDADSPEEADATAAALESALAADATHFRSVRRPDALPFFRQNGFLFLDRDKLEQVLNQTIDAQPFLGQLAADPSARGLFAALSLVALGVEQGNTDLSAYTQSLRGFQKSIDDALAGHPKPLSWTRLIASSAADLGGKYRFVLAQPKLDFGALEPGGVATSMVRATAAALPFVQAGTAHVRITGSVALADEEFATVAHGALAGTIGSLLLVIVWLVLAVRSWRLIVPIVLTLALGLTFTIGFAALAVGTLNLISVAFAILFVGIAVDFAIQFCVRYREARHELVDPALSLSETGRRCGTQILIAACATAAGFLAFVPTDFKGVAELGLIAGGGMLIAFLCTILFLPALLTLMRPRAEAAEVGFRWAAPADHALAKYHRVSLGVFGALAVLGVILLPRLTFDADPLHTKNPNTEAMRTLYDLMASPLTNPYRVDILAADAAAADADAAKLGALSLVDSVVTLSSFVPRDQPEKLALVADAANILGPTLAPRPTAAAVSVADIRLAARSAAANLAKASPKLPASHPLVAIADDLAKLVDAPDATVKAADAALTRFLPEEIEQLREALTAAPVTLESLPPELTRDWKLPDGRVRVEALAKSGARDATGIRDFVGQVRTIVPEAGGSAVTIYETSRTIVGAFRSAALLALVAIAAILALALRRLLDASLVLAPLLMSALMTIVIAALLPLPLNFANIIALPLLLGVGVSFNIYFIMNWRAGRTQPLGSATARAVLFSALTTGTAFGSLALSGHPGTASMGKLLLISLACTLIASLAFVPSLLSMLGAPERRRIFSARTGS